MCLVSCFVGHPPPCKVPGDGGCDNYRQFPTENRQIKLHTNNYQVLNDLPLVCHPRQDIHPFEQEESIETL